MNDSLELQEDDPFQGAVRLARHGWDDRDLLMVGPKGIIPVHEAARQLGLPAPATWEEFLESSKTGIPCLTAIDRQLENVSEGWLDESSISFGPVTRFPQKIICIGLNYRKHAQESGMDPPHEPVVFGKFANALAGHENILVLDGNEQLDYEAELGVVIAKFTRNVSPQYALEHVLGYCNVNDLSDRATQFRSSQWLLGKTRDEYLPTGPWLTIPPPGFNPQSLRIRCWLNNELRQDSSTEDMIFGVADIIAYLSRFMTLNPGDIIATGTPEGVIMGRDDPQWMKDGDVVTVEIEGLGRLRTYLQGN